MGWGSCHGVGMGCCELGMGWDRGWDSCLWVGWAGQSCAAPEVGEMAGGTATLLLPSRLQHA